MPSEWTARLGPTEEFTDVAIRVPLEGTFVTRRRLLSESQGWRCSVDEWGRTLRSRDDAYFYEVLEAPLASARALDTVQFDPPDLDERFLLGQANLAEAQVALSRDQKRFCVFGKTGGPYLRSSFVRGETQFLMDIAGDPPLAQAIVDKVADHLLRVGLEEIRRWGLQDTGMWIFDDMAYNSGPVFSPKSFERIFLPAYRRMIRAYKQAGARYVFFHSDGNILPLLDMLVDAGIDGINPLERRAGMDPVALRSKYPRLVLAGGVDNTDTLINGPPSRIESEVRALIDLGRNGGLIIGTHSISPEVTLDHFEAYHRTCEAYGGYC
ncbi:MAG: hypothetical protein NT154_18315 [Verrucomicrobia bacterium]|nr:hypothetical protein [Verrucomicrobiota bacterium]